MARLKLSPYGDNSRVVRRWQSTNPDEKGITMRLAWALVAVLVVLWMLGLGLHIAGSLIHLLLVVALIVFIVDLFGGRRAAV